MKRALFVAMVSGLMAVSASAQEAPAIKVDSKPLKISQVDTPQFQASNVPEKRWRPKTWLELDLEFQVRLPQSAGGRNGSLGEMTVNYYLALNAMVDNRRQVVKGTFNYVDIPSSEVSHALAYISPPTLRRLLLKDNVTAASDVQGWGYEIMVGGQRVAGESSTGTPWWEKGESFDVHDNVMLAKKETPFGILWGDYDVNVRK